MNTPTTTLTFHWRGNSAPVSSVNEASAKWSAFRDALMYSGQEAGCSSIGNGGTVKCGRKIVARISYNGRIHPAS